MKVELKPHDKADIGISCLPLIIAALVCVFGMVAAAMTVPEHAYAANGDIVGYAYLDKDENGENSALVIRDTRRSQKEIDEMECIDVGTIIEGKDYPWLNYTKLIRSVRFETAEEDGAIRPRLMIDWFCDCQYLESFDARHLDTSKTESMQYLFQFCYSLESLDLSSFDTSSLRKAHCMFRDCTSLRSLDLSSFDTSQVWLSENMFDGCTALSRIVLGPKFTCDSPELLAFPDGSWQREGDEQQVFDDLESMMDYVKAEGVPVAFVGPLDGISKMQETQGHWGDCRWTLYPEGRLVVSPSNDNAGSLGDGGLPLSAEDRKWVKSIVFEGHIVAKTCNGLFSGCTRLESIDLASLDTSQATSMRSMFENCRALASLDLSSLDTSHVADMGFMFEGCSSLSSLDLTSFDTSRATSLDSMFQDCTALRSVDLSSFDTSSVESMDYLIDGCASMGEIDITSFDTSNMVSMDYAFNARDMRKVYVGKGFVPIRSSVGLAQGAWQSTKTGQGFKMCDAPSGIADVYIKVADDGDPLYATLLESGELRIRPGNPCETESEKTWLVNVYDWYSSAEEVPWHDWRDEITSVSAESRGLILDFSYWFYGCKNLQHVDLSKLSFECAWRLESMFDGCVSLKSVIFPERSYCRIHPWDLANMFRNCSSLTFLDLTDFNTRSARDMRHLFQGCRSLRAVKLGSSFTFRGTKPYRLPGGELPYGAWRTSAEEGTAYLSDSVPNFTAATYTKMLDAEVASSPDVSVVSVERESEEGKPQLSVSSEIGDDGLEHLSYEVGEDYVGDTLYVGDSPRASAAKLMNATVGRDKVLDRVRASGWTSKVVLLPSVARVEPYAFQGTGVSYLTVKSARLTSSYSVYNCLRESSVSKVKVKLSSPAAKAAVKKAFKTWSGKKAKVK